MEDELPSVSITMRFLDLCDHYGSQRAIVGLVAAGRKVGVSGLPGHADWPAWDADEMQAAVKYLEEATNRNGGAAVDLSAAPPRRRVETGLYREAPEGELND